MSGRAIPLMAAVPGMLLLAGCTGQQSAFVPTGVEAQRIDTLFWIMTIPGGLIFLGVLLAIALAMAGGAGPRRVLSSERFIAGAGIAFPVAVLSVLLIYGFVVLRAGAASNGDGLRIGVSGERWWWRVTYTAGDGTTFEAANELHVPVGEPVTLELSSPDVIHSFWAPQLAGKLDMIPGRTNRLTLTATEAGISRGQCAEYCGGAHALMSFHVVAETPEAFDAWLAREAADALPPADARAQRGAQLFQQSGCGACHTVRGTGATGTIGPDLTHVGSRHSLAAATLPNDAGAFAAWIEDNQHIKPENQMPPFDIFSAAQLADLGLYLEGLQ